MSSPADPHPRHVHRSITSVLHYHYPYILAMLVYLPHLFSYIHPFTYAVIFLSLFLTPPPLHTLFLISFHPHSFQYFVASIYVCPFVISTLWSPLIYANDSGNVLGTITHVPGLPTEEPRVTQTQQTWVRCLPNPGPGWLLRPVGVPGVYTTQERGRG